MIKSNLELAYKRTHKNFMTPNVIKYEITDDYRVIELSEGTGIEGNPIFGVTEFDDSMHTTRRGQMHRSKQSANKHYKQLLTQKYDK